MMLRKTANVVRFLENLLRIRIKQLSGRNRNSGHKVVKKILINIDHSSRSSSEEREAAKGGCPESGAAPFDSLAGVIRNTDFSVKIPDKEGERMKIENANRDHIHGVFKKNADNKKNIWLSD